MTDKRLRASIKVSMPSAAAVPMRCFQHVYVCFEETLDSNKKLRTYLDVSMHPQLYFVPSYFFERERECLERDKTIIDYINEHFSESRRFMPAHAPVSAAVVRRVIGQLKMGAPELINRARDALRLKG